MPRIVLTDIVLKTVKPGPRQTQYWDASLPSFGCRVSPAGTKTFNVMIGKDRRLIKIGNYPSMTLGVARKRAHELIEDHDPTALSFNAARDLFASQHLDTLKASTAHEQKNLMRRFHFFKPVAAITSSDVARILNDMPRGSGRSCFNVIRTFFNWCVANGYLIHNPLKRSPYKPQFRDRLLTDAEIKEIWWTSMNHSFFGGIVRQLILTGQRLNQIASLQRSWIHDDTITFPVEVMKSNTAHTIPFGEYARFEYKRFEPHPTSRFVFNSHDKPFSNFSLSMEALRKELSHLPHFTLHDFRRYFSSQCAFLNIPIDVTEAILDHRAGSRTQIQRVYDRHDRLPQMRSALERYENHIENIIEQIQ